MKAGISVFFPCYNEEGNIRNTVNKAVSVLSRHFPQWEIIIIDDGSRDRSPQIADKLASANPQIRVIHHPRNLGYGAALQSGFYAAKFPWIAFTDIDGQFDLADLPKFFTRQKATAADLVIGYYLSRQVSAFTRLTSKIWELLVFILFGLHVRDIDCAFKLVSKKVIDSIPRLRSQRGAFISSELLIKARQQHFRIAEVGVRHFPRTAGQATGRHLRVIIKSFLDLFGLWWELRRNILEFIALAGILVVAAYSRLWHINDYLTFLGDEGRDALVARDIVTGKKLTLLGPGTSVGSMYLGPLYYYLMVFPLWLFNLSPVGPAVQVALLGVAAVALTWWMGRRWFGRMPGLVSALLFAISPVAITYSRSSWNPNVMPFFAALTIWSLWQGLVARQERWLWITGISLAFVLNSHYLGLLLIPVAAFWWLVTPFSSSKWRHTIFGLVLFTLLMFPLVWFDLRHNGQNFSAVKTFFTQRQTTVNLKPYKALPLIYPLLDQLITVLVAAKAAFWGQITTLVTLGGSLFMFWYSRRRLPKPWWFIWSWIFVGVVGLGLYKQHIYDHYFGFLYPAIFLLIGSVLSWWLIKLPLWAKWLPLLFLGLLIWQNLLFHPLRFAPNYQLQRTRQVAELISSQAGGPYNLALISDHNYDAAYRYFITALPTGYHPIQERHTSQLFVICEIPDCRPINHPLYEIAAFGWARIDREWEFPWGVKVFRLVPNPSGQ